MNRIETSKIWLKEVETCPLVKLRSKNKAIPKRPQKLKDVKFDRNVKNSQAKSLHKKDAYDYKNYSNFDEQSLIEIFSSPYNHQHTKLEKRKHENINSVEV